MTWVPDPPSSPEFDVPPPPPHPNDIIVEGLLFVTFKAVSNDIEDSDITYRPSIHVETLDPNHLLPHLSHHSGVSDVIIAGLVTS